MSHSASEQVLINRDPASSGFSNAMGWQLLQGADGTYRIKRFRLYETPEEYAIPAEWAEALLLSEHAP